MGKRYPQFPLVGVGALILQDERVLLVQRSQPPGLGMWSLPGGLLEVGEGLTQALRREVEEETGLLVQPGKLLQVLEMVLPDVQGRIEYHYILFNYLCQISGGVLRAGSDAAQAAWFAARGLPEQVWPDTRALLDEVLQEGK